MRVSRAIQTGARSRQTGFLSIQSPGKERVGRLAWRGEPPIKHRACGGAGSDPPLRELQDARYSRSCRKAGSSVGPLGSGWFSGSPPEMTWEVSMFFWIVFLHWCYILITNTQKSRRRLLWGLQVQSLHRTLWQPWYELLRLRESPSKMSLQPLGLCFKQEYSCFSSAGGSCVLSILRNRPAIFVFQLLPRKKKPVATYSRALET